MATIFGNLLKNMPSPLLMIVAGYIGLRSLEIALRPQDTFRTRMAHALMTVSAIGLFLMTVALVVGEVLRAIGVFTPPWPASAQARL